MWCSGSLHSFAPAARRPASIGRLAGGILAVATALLVTACSPTTQPAPYAERLASQRTAKDAFFRTAPDSPILPADRDRFLPLAYYPIDEAFVVGASLAPSEREPAMEMPTSTGQRRQMRRAGSLQFSLRGQPLALTAFVEASAPDMNRLFLPFGDMTNGTETYPAGRYLDLDRTPTGLYTIDFNKAYHPYCYYNETYDCPYPPPENRLPVLVRAGERVREH